MKFCQTCSCRLKAKEELNCYCDFCSKLYFKRYEDKRIYRDKPVKIKKKLAKIDCTVCKKIYQPRTAKQKFCSDVCRPKPKTEAQKWLDKKPANASGVHSDQVGYSFFRKKYSLSKKFNACRG